MSRHRRLLPFSTPPPEGCLACLTLSSPSYPQTLLLINSFKLFKINSLIIYARVKPSASHLQEKTFRAVDKLCLSLGQPVVSRLVPKNANPACPLLRIRTMGGKPLKLRLFQGAPRFHALTQGCPGKRG